MLKEIDSHTLPVIHITHQLLSKKVIKEFVGKLKIEYYWDSHGKLVPFETVSHKNFTTEGKFRLEEEEIEIFYDGKSTGIYYTWKLYCDDKLIATDVYQISKTKAKVVIGWG